MPPPTLLDALHTEPAASDAATPELERKAADLHAALAALPSLVVALSGGVDSAVLLAAAQRAVRGPLLAVTIHSPAQPPGEDEAASGLARALRVAHESLPGHELDVPGFATNPPDRCYHCKRHLFTSLRALAAARGFAVVAEGSNVDDLGDYRPGRRALAELGILSPLCDAGLTKSEIRALARRFGLSVADKPSLACLASRFPYGERITAAGLQRVAQAEAWLTAKLPAGTQLRVRSHGDIARIELAPDAAAQAAFAARAEIHAALCAFGFRYVALELGGYRTGSLNATLTAPAPAPPAGPGGSAHAEER